MHASPFAKALRFASSLLIFAFTWLSSSAALAAPGAVLQTTLLKIPGGIDKSYALAVQPDGKILAAGYAYLGTRQFAITRYNANGSVDTTFADAGTRLEWLGPGDAEAHGIGVQSTGKIVVAGFATSDQSRFGLARFNSDGSLDTSFGGGGAITTIGTGSAAVAMALQSDDKIVLAGWSTSGGVKLFTLARYDANSPTLDTTFGSGGIVVGSAGANDQQINAIAIQSDGRIVAVGSDGAGAVIARRYNTDGSLDTTFATAGTFSTSSMAGGRAVAVLSNGQILLAGEVPGNGAFEVARLTASGALDTTFGVGGFAQQGVGSSNGQAHGIQVQSDGKIVVAGTGLVSQPAVAVARFNADGSNDTTFGNSGAKVFQLSIQGDEGDALAILGNGEIVVAGAAGRQPADCACTPSSSAVGGMLIGFNTSGAVDASFAGGGFALDRGSKQSAGYASALRSDGKLVVAGYDKPVPTVPSVSSGLVARYNVDGTLDTTFGTNGVVESAPDQFRAVAIQPDGKIVAAGLAQGNFHGNPATRMAIARFNSNGTADSTFGTSGIVYVPLDGPTEEAYGIALQSDGKIVVGGVGQLQGGFTDALFARLNPDGTLDTGFGGTGKVRVAMSTGSDQVNAVAIQSDGKIVGAGWGQLSGSQDGFAAVRLNTDGSLDSSFGGGGVVTTAIGTSIAHGNALAIQIDGKIVVGGQAFGTSTDDFALARYNTDGTLDTSFGSGGKVTTDVGNHNRIFALTILPSGKIAAAGEWATSFGIIQYLPSGAVDTSFGSGGSVLLTMNTATNDIAHSIVQRSDGNLWVSGEASGVAGLALIAGDGGTVSKVNPSVTVSSSLNPSNSGQSVTFTASVSGSNGAASGTVTFADGSTTLCSAVALSSGSASCTTASLAAGTHTISASYSGDTHYNAASASLSQSVQGNTGASAASSITSPTPGTAFGSTSITFSWDAGTGVTQWFLAVGTYPGGNDIYGNYVNTQSQTVSGLPTNGATLYVTLMSMINGAWQSKDYSYSAMSGGQSSVVYPVPGSVLPSTAVVISWTQGSGVTQRFLAVGTTPGGNDLFGGYVTDQSSQTVTNLPVNGTPVYVRLMSMINGAWKSFDYTYTGMTAAEANLSNLTSPVPGSVIAPSTIFNWTAGNGVTNRFLAVGTQLNGNDIYGSYEYDQLSQPVINIPRNGATVYVTLMSLINGTWQTNNYIFSEATPDVSVITGPVPGSVISGSSATFTWDAGQNVTNRFLAVGTYLGGNDIYGSYTYDAMSQTVTGLPPGRTIYVRLMSMINGSWKYYDFTYTTQ